MSDGPQERMIPHELAVSLNKARQVFQQSEEYLQAFDDAGSEPYRDYALVSAFIAGWSARGCQIKVTQND
jgi:hypothetical protein